MKLLWPLTSALRACADAQVTLCEDEPLAKGLLRPLVSYGVFRPGLDHPPGRGEEDLDISNLGVPGIVGRDSPTERPERPLELPNLLLESALSAEPRLRLGGCLAADERLRRWPVEEANED